MKNYLVLFATFSLLMACEGQIDLKKMPRPQSSATMDASQQLIRESNLSDYWMEPDGRTWKDVDMLYKSLVGPASKRVPAGDPASSVASDNFRASAIACMVQVYGLLEDNSEEAKQAIAYYAKEMSGIPTCSPELLYPMLERLQGELSPEEIATIAQNAYQNSEALFAVMKQHKVPKYLERQTARENLKKLF